MTTELMKLITILIERRKQHKTQTLSYPFSSSVLSLINKTKELNALSCMGLKLKKLSLPQSPK
jgi:hypothetical protein